MLAADRVRRLGDGVALVMAEDPHHAAAPARLIDFDFDPLSYRTHFDSPQLVVPIYQWGPQPNASR
jgi:CO/xanthine dehydrogenase Mo-binding subunit